MLKNKSTLTPNQLVIITTLIISMSGILFGYDTGILAGTLPLVEQQFALQSTGAGLIVASLALGAAVGTLFNVFQKDVFSRRKVMQIAAILFIIGAILSCSALNNSWLIAGRFIIGLGIGISSSIAPIYIAEICPAAMRGMHVTTNVVFITGGILLAYIIARYLAPMGCWRIMLMLGIIPALSLSILIRFCPESPRWLIKNNLVQEASDSLKKLSGQQYQEIFQKITNITQKKLPTSLKRLIFIGITLAFLQQFCGINAILYYAPKIFNSLGNNNLSQQLDLAIYIGFTNFIATLASGLISDRIGRRTLFIFCFSVMFLSLFSLSLFSQSIPHTLNVSLIISFIFFYGLSIGCLFWVVISEIFPTHYRSTAASISTMANWIANFTVSFSFLPLLNLIHIQRLFAVYAFFCLLGAVFCKLFLKETKQASLEDIEQTLRSAI